MKNYLTILVLLSVFQLFGQVSFNSSNLPIVILNTSGKKIPDEPKITASMKIISNENGNRNSLTDTAFNFNGLIGIELRGNSSLSFDQKQYTVETRDANGVNLDVSLLGMPAENDWVLYAPFNDYSLIRNVFAYNLWNMMGYWAPRTKMVELVLNDEYQGVYVLTETIKKDDNRLDISKLNPIDTAGLELTGGYIMRIDASNSDEDLTFESKVPGVSSSFNNTVTWMHYYPDPKDIHPKQQDYIHKYIDTVELLIQSDKFNDPVSGYSKYLNVQSFIDYFIHSEFCLNADGYKRSAYFFKDKLKSDGTGGNFNAGPVWDYNLAFGLCNFCNGNKIDTWAYKGCDTNPTPYMWKRLLEDPDFINEVKCRYNDLRSEILNEEYLFAFIDTYASLLQEAQVRHFEQWEGLLDDGSSWGGGFWGGSSLWFNAYTVESYAEEISTFKEWISDRLEFLDNNLEGTCTSNEVLIDVQVAYSVHPNPFSDILYIESASPVKSITIYDLNGTRILDKEADCSNITYIDDLINLSGNIYFVEITTCNGAIYREKVIKR